MSSIVSDLQKKLKSIDLSSVDVSKSAGRVLSCNDGVITIEGLSQVKNGELLSFRDGTKAMAMNLEKDNVGAILFSSDSDVSYGDYVFSTGKVAGVGVGDELLGRVIDPLGVAIDGKRELNFIDYYPTERPAPGILDRAKVNRTLETGIKIIDSMVPIGKGQRELIIGDRQTGKTAICLDAIVNQKGKNVVCIYVAIGQKSSNIARIVDDLTKQNALEYTVVVASTASQSAPMQYLAPYTGTAIAEYFMDKGRDVLIVYDDLSKHAVAYRTISLLLRRPSGREAYPGDIFYIHSRLLERSAQLSAEKGGGSLTALPVVETQAGDISSYIPTNVISITDGQIYLESELFHLGVRPAVNVGLSVSRVGSSAQTDSVRKQCGSIRLEHAHYREMQLFARFGADLDAGTRLALARGDRLTEALKQERYHPSSMPELTAELLILNKDVMRGLTVQDVKPFVRGFINVLREEKSIFERIEKSGKLSEDDENKILEEAENYRREYMSK